MPGGAVGDYGGDLGRLLEVQQADGGWGYGATSSWTEPTSYSILALRAADGPAEAIGRACEWLARHQLPDGGWSPGPAVELSTSVTSLALLALTGMSGYGDVAERGVECLLRQAGAETTLLARMVRVAMGVKSTSDHSGWPWYPGASSWVIPTSLSIIALGKHRQGRCGQAIVRRVVEAQGFLLSRRCPDGGWNHGGLFKPDEKPESYPETTGLALLALQGRGGIEISLRCGEKHARYPRSSEGTSWLRLGLAAHGRGGEIPGMQYRDWTINETALGIIVQNLERIGNPFGSHA